MWRHKFWNFFHSAPTMVAPLWVLCVYQSAQKCSRYLTDNISRLLAQRYAQYLFFIKRAWTSFSPAFYVWFFKKHICYILLTDQILLSDCIYFLRYWVICLLYFFVVKSVTSYIFKLTIVFLSCYLTKKSGQKYKYLKNEKSF